MWSEKMANAAKMVQQPLYSSVAVNGAFRVHAGQRVMAAEATILAPPWAAPCAALANMATDGIGTAPRAAPTSKGMWMIAC